MRSATASFRAPCCRTRTGRPISPPTRSTRCWSMAASIKADAPFAPTPQHETFIDSGTMLVTTGDNIDTWEAEMKEGHGRDHGDSFDEKFLDCSSLNRKTSPPAGVAGALPPLPEGCGPDGIFRKGRPRCLRRRSRVISPRHACGPAFGALALRLAEIRRTGSRSLILADRRRPRPCRVGRARLYQQVQPVQPDPQPVGRRRRRFRHDGGSGHLGT